MVDEIDKIILTELGKFLGFDSPSLFSTWQAGRSLKEWKDMIDTKINTEFPPES